MNNPIGWFKQIDNAHAGKSVICPKCGSKRTEASFFMFSNGIGYGDMSCKDCGDSAHISRMKFPENTKVQITYIK